jgi:hypothetical protein
LLSSVGRWSLLNLGGMSPPPPPPHTPWKVQGELRRFVRRPFVGKLVERRSSPCSPVNLWPEVKEIAI